MLEITKVPVYIIIYFLHLCCLWSTPALAASKDNAIARVVGARNQESSIWMQLAEDNSSDTGWAVDVLRYTNQGITDAGFHVIMYAKEKHKPSFRHYFFRNTLCALVSKKTNHPKLSFDRFMPTQIMKMILPKREGSCNFQKGKRAIQKEARVNADRRDSKNKDLGIPYSFPFDLMVNVIRVSEDRDPLNAFTFQVNFTVDLIDNENNKNNVIKTEELTEKAADVIINVPARVIGVKNGIDNKHFSAVEDTNSSSGWSVKSAKWTSRYSIDWDLKLDLYDMAPTNSKSMRHIFHGYLCDTLVYNSRYNGYPEKNYLPRQIAGLIFPAGVGTCEFAPKNYPITPNGIVNLNPFDNPDVKQPMLPFFNLIANVRSREYDDKPEDVYYFQVNFTIGDSSFKINDKDKKKCLGIKWKSDVLKKACEGFEVIKSSVSDTVQQVKKTVGKGL